MIYKKNGLIDALDECLKNISAELRLYGSRTDETRKGGDIDLLLIVEDEKNSLSLNKIKHHILAKMKSKIGDQRIDFKICTKKDIKSDPFLKMVFPDSIPLNEWIIEQTSGHS